jgi:hypothetical protein
MSGQRGFIEDLFGERRRVFVVGSGPSNVPQRIDVGAEAVAEETESLTREVEDLKKQIISQKAVFEEYVHSIRDGHYSRELKSFASSWSAEIHTMFEDIETTQNETKLLSDIEKFNGFIDDIVSMENREKQQQQSQVIKILREYQPYGPKEYQVGEDWKKINIQFYKIFHPEYQGDNPEAPDVQTFIKGQQRVLGLTDSQEDGKIGPITMGKLANSLGLTVPTPTQGETDPEVQTGTQSTAQREGLPAQRGELPQPGAPEASPVGTDGGRTESAIARGESPRPAEVRAGTVESSRRTPERATETIFITATPQMLSEMRIIGRYQTPENGEVTLEDIYRDFPDLRDQLSRSGIPEEEYFRALPRSGRTIHIVEPQETADTILARHRGEAESLRQVFSSQRQERSQYIWDNRESYLQTTGETSRLGCAELLRYVNNDEIWNDVWERRSGERTEYTRQWQRGGLELDSRQVSLERDRADIDGLARVVDILGTLGVSRDGARDVLRNLLRQRRWGLRGQTAGGINFESVFRTIIVPNGLYDGNFRNFQRELNGLETDLDGWLGAEGEEKFEALTDFYRLDAEVNKLKESQPDTYHTTETYKEWGDKSREQISGEAVGYLAVRYHEVGIANKLTRLNKLRSTILDPVSNLLDAVIEMRIVNSEKEPFVQRYRGLIEGLESYTPPIRTDSPFFSFQQVVEREPGSFDVVENPEASPSISLSREVRARFIGTLRVLFSRFPGDAIKPDSFNDEQILKIVFGIYSIDNLAREGCLRRMNDNPNQILLHSLPMDFNAGNPRLVQLFRFLPDGERVDTDRGRDLLEQLSPLLDENMRVISVLGKIFGTGEAARGMETHHNFRERFIASLTGRDTRATEITMADISAGRVTLPTQDFLNRYLSGNSAVESILAQITTWENGVQRYDSRVLSSKLQERFEIGLTFVSLNDQLSHIKDALPTELQDLNDPEIRARAMEVYRAQIDGISADTPGVSLSPEALEIIRVGEVMYRVRESNRSEFELSRDDSMRQIQEHMLRTGFSNQEIREMENIFSHGRIDLGVLFGDDGSVGAGAAINIDLGNGWSVTPAAGAGFGPQGISGGVGASVGRTFNLTKDGKVAATIGAHGSTMGVGVNGNIVFPFTKGWDANLGVSASVTPIGLVFTAGGGFRINRERQHREATRDALEERGLAEINDLIERGANPDVVATALISLENYGDTFSDLRDRGFSSQGLIDVFNVFKGQIQDSVLDGPTLPFGIYWNWSNSSYC